MRFRYTQEGPNPARGRVLLDGYDASSAVRGFTVHADIRDVTTVTLDAVVLHGADLDLDGEILIPAPMVALLTQFGWTPPDGAEVRGGAMRLSRVPTKEPDPPDQIPKCNCQGDWHGGEHTSDCPVYKPRVGGHDVCVYEAGICTIPGPCP